jgi:hypothetical protein
MKKRIQAIATSLMMLVGVGSLAFGGSAAYAIDIFSGPCGSSGQGNTAQNTQAGGNGQQQAASGTSNTLCGASATDDAPSIVKTVINTMLFILGMIAVIMIIIGGIRYTTSNGDSSQVKAAKDTILYAVVGLVVAILAFAIVNFVVTNIGGGGGGTT